MAIKIGRCLALPACLFLLAFSANAQPEFQFR
jgi:hypothetical protein